MGLDNKGVETMKNLGKEGIRKKFLDHQRQVWTKMGKLKEKEASRFSNVCCILLMVLFFGIVIASKLNEETLSLFGMTQNSEMVVSIYESGLL